jgi:hypothetical protein
VHGVLRETTDCISVLIAVATDEGQSMSLGALGTAAG